MKRIVTSAVLAAALITAGCAHKGPKGERPYIAQDVETLYSVAHTTLERKQYKLAGQMFDEVERQHPYSVWARRSQLMSAFSYYMARDYQQSILAAQRFLSLHPGNRDAPYAYYLIAIGYYEQISDVSRDQQITQKALDALSELIRRYPESQYADDARLKVDLATDHLAGKEMTIGRVYQNQGLYLAAALRFRTVVDNYNTTSHVPEALERLTEVYLQLGVPEEARKSAAVLGFNYPGSPWYERAYKLTQKYPG